MNHPPYPAFDRERFRVVDDSDWSVRFWKLMPITAVNELWDGQRIPKITLIDRESEAPLAERTYVPCPHCKTLHDGRKWHPRFNLAFGHFYGLFCPTCGGIIPCIENYVAAGLRRTGRILIPVPIRDRHYQRWLERQPARYEILRREAMPKYNESGLIWLHVAAKFTGFMLLIYAVIAVLAGDEIPSPGQILYATLLAAIGGLSFGLMMYLWANRKGRARAQDAIFDLNDLPVEDAEAIPAARDGNRGNSSSASR
jgi:hypothetical protein